MPRILEAQNIMAGYNGREVLKDVSLRIGEAERILVTGPNGCGKTTLLRVLAGILRQRTGHISLKGVDISATSCYERCRLGIGYLMQTRNVFPSLTIEENLRLGGWASKEKYEIRREQILELFPFLKEKFNFRAGLLSGGQRQSLAIAMVLMRHIEVLLLDEPTAGLSPNAAGQVLEALQSIDKKSCWSVIIVEHNLRRIMPWVSRLVVMDQGSIVTEEAANLVAVDNKLQELFFRK
jgi:ABC-type branched-subunit amino acid transport system ATPase component